MRRILWIYARDGVYEMGRTDGMKLRCDGIFPINSMMCVPLWSGIPCCVEWPRTWNICCVFLVTHRFVGKCVVTVGFTISSNRFSDGLEIPKFLILFLILSSK